MKKQILLLILMPFLIFLFSASAGAEEIGPGILPDWHGQAQVQLGWIFSDPTNPQTSVPISGWEKAIGSIPVWSYDANRTAFGNPAQWYIKIPNLNNNNPVKHMWISWVYDFDSLASGPRIATQINWFPFTDWVDRGMVDEWFDEYGNPTTNHMVASYGRVTWNIDLYPNPEYEEIWLGLFSGNHYVREVYVITMCEDPCECDLNHDGQCDMQDWLIFGEDWGRTDCKDIGVECECDLNDDGRCDMQDWLSFGDDWGRIDCPTAAAILRR